jgi:hypothetical protein
MSLTGFLFLSTNVVVVGVVTDLPFLYILSTLIFVYNICINLFRCSGRENGL